MCSITVRMVREESRQDFLSAALAPGLMANQAAEVCPFIVEGSCLHNSTRRSLYLALLLCVTPAAAVPRSAISAQMEVNPYALERSELLCPMCVRSGAAGGALSGVSFCCALLGTLVVSKPCFLQALGALQSACLSLAPKARQLGFVLCMFGQKSVVIVRFAVSLH